MVTGRFIDNTTIECIAPIIQEPGDYSVEVSEDGLPFTKDGVLFSFYGRSLLTQFFRFTILALQSQTIPLLTRLILIPLESPNRERWGILMGVLVVGALCALTGTAIGVYYHRRKKEKIAIEQFSLMNSGMFGIESCLFSIIYTLQ